MSDLFQLHMASTPAVGDKTTDLQDEDDDEDDDDEPVDKWFRRSRPREGNQSYETS